MSLDADDLIENRLVEYISKNPSKSGYFINKGYIWSVGKSFMLKQSRKMHQINGSTHIINSKIIPIPSSFSENLKFTDFNFFSSHGYLKQRLKEKKIELTPIPFYALIYRAHGNNWTNINEMVNAKSLKNVIKTIIRFKWISNSIKIKFNL